MLDMELELHNKINLNVAKGTDPITNYVGVLKEQVQRRMHSLNALL